jgi:parvulin-like peptidyl-prolyl isomerase
MKKFLSIVIFMTMFLFTGCSLFKTDKALITVNGQAITQKDYDDLFKMQNTSNVDPNTNKGLYLIMKHNVVNELVIRQLIREEIQNHKIKVSDEEISKALNEAYAQVGGKEQFNKFLKKVYGIDEKEFKKTLKEEIEISKLIDKIAPMTKTSDGESKSFYEKNKQTLFNQPRMVRASHILIMANRDDLIKEIKKQSKNISDADAQLKADAKMTELQKKAEEILKKATLDSNNFDKLAKEYSQDLQTAKKGGDLDFFSYEDMTKPFADAAFSCKPSTVCEKIVKTDYGFHIIKVTDRKEAGMVPFDEIKEEIKTKLTQEKRNKAFQEYINSKQAKATIKYQDTSYDPKVIEKELRDVAKNFSQAKLQGTKK